ncbi:MAG: glutathionylspermidine synthase family protein [Phaeodactylibacter sp.]|uniref:glutathionylspermidine synthase family protein n=1 Tax=Phaeodactylibacter sp. TaxID=1940289 RepID=UPI0032EB6DDE
MLDNRLTDIGRLSPRQLRKQGLEWFIEGDNHDYFAPELLGLADREISTFSQAASELYERLLLAARKVGEQELWEAAGIPVNAVEAVDHSLRREWGNHLVGRFDFAGGLDEVPLKMLEFNGDTLSLMPETLSVQPMMLDALPRRERKNARQWNHLRTGLVKGLKQILQRYPNRPATLLLIGLGHEEDWLNLDVIEMAAKQAGFEEVHRAPMEEVIFSEEEGIFLEIEPEEFLRYDFVFKMAPWEFIAYEEPELMRLLTQVIKRDLCVILNPAYSMLLQSKALLPMLHELGIQHPALLKASRSAAAFPGHRYAEKPMYGRTGDNVRLFDGSAQPIAENEGDYGDFPRIYQELAPFNIDSDGDRYQPSVYIASGEACALCFRRQDGLIVDDDAEFVGHYVKA